MTPPTGLLVLGREGSCCCWCYTAETKCYGPSDSDNTRVFTTVVGAAFSLRRAALLTDAPTRQWPGALHDAQELLDTLLKTNALAFTTEHRLQGWTAGYYLKNAKLRLEEALQRLVETGRISAESLRQAQAVSLMGTDVDGII